jgi:hypothetical protein
MAQTDIQPRDEVFGGYSWLHPNGRVDFGYKVENIAKGFDSSNVYYVPAAQNLGILLDGSGHFGNDTEVGYILGGLQYKYHTDSFSPFVRFFVGTTRIDPPAYISAWNLAVGAGGGLDLNVTHTFAVRLAQVDYIHTDYRAPFPGDPTWNSIRLVAGVVVNLGNYYAPALSAACAATPVTVMTGEAITVTATGTNFNPKHTVTYLWTTTGGKLSSTSMQSATVDTTGMAGGTYTANATLSDPKGPKTHNVATCGASFNVKAPRNPPQVTCSRVRRPPS